MCGSDADGVPWVVLNRFVVGSGASYSATSVLTDDDYVWETSAEGDEKDSVSGYLLCFPSCLQTFIEGRMLEADIESGV